MSQSVTFSVLPSESLSHTSSATVSPSHQSFQQVSNTTMTATATPQFYTTSFPTVTPTYSPTQNATLPIIMVDGQATNMTTTNALLAATLALIIVAVALAAGRYVPAGWAQRFRRMVPQKTIDDFKRDPLGSVTAIVNDPNSILKDIKIPDSVKSITNLVPQELKDKFVPESVLQLVAPSTATVSHVQADAKDDKIERPSTPEHKPTRLAPSPIPVGEVETVTGITEDSGVILKTNKELLVRQPSTTLQINTEDVAAVKAFLESRGTSHNVLG
jgi:hypothetical protein